MARLEFHPEAALVREELVVVLAVAHVRRHPEYWLERAKSSQRP